MYTDEEIAAAVEELKEFYQKKAFELMRADWVFYITEEAPETYNDLITAWRETGMIPVKSGASDRTIYDCEWTNILLRFWHDVTHIQLEKGFDRHSEIDVIQHQHNQLSGLSRLANNVFFHDMAGQTMYYERRGKFVGDQKQFVLDCLQHDWRYAQKRDYP